MIGETNEDPNVEPGASPEESKVEKEEQPTIPNFEDGLNLLLSQGAIFSMLPIERWIEELNHAETLAPILDPTLARQYMYSRRDEQIKPILQAALKFKQAILNAREIEREKLANASRKQFERFISNRL